MKGKGGARAAGGVGRFVVGSRYRNDVRLCMYVHGFPFLFPSFFFIFLGMFKSGHR